MSEPDAADILYPSEQPAAPAASSSAPDWAQALYPSEVAAADAASEQSAPDAAPTTTKPTESSQASPEASQGVPEAYSLQAPEGLTIAPEHVEMAAPVFRELGLSNEAANKLMPVAAKFAESVVAQVDRESADAFATWKRDLIRQAQADPEIGGAKWRDSINLAAHALDKLGAPAGSPLRKLLDDTGVGNHPEMIRVFARAGRLLGAKAPPRPRSAAETLYG